MSDWKKMAESDPDFVPPKRFLGMRPVFWVLLLLVGVPSASAGWYMFTERPWETACQKVDRICAGSDDFKRTMRCNVVRGGVGIAGLVGQMERMADGEVNAKAPVRTEATCRDMLAAMNE